MFGATFREKTCLLNLSDEGFAFKLLRPVGKGGRLEINLSPDNTESKRWIAVEVIWVNYGLDGYQRVGVRINPPSQLARQQWRDEAR